MDGSGDKCRDSLESIYHYYRQIFEDRSRLTWQEESKVRHPEVKEHVKKLYADFWNQVDNITRLYFKMLDLLERKRDVEDNIAKIWAGYVSSPKEAKKSRSSECYSKCLGKKSCIGKNSVGKNTSEVVKWYKTRVVRYKTASEFAGELRLSILIAIQEAETADPFLSLSPVFSQLETKEQWFIKQVQDLEHSMQQLDITRHLLPLELNITTNNATAGSLNLTVKKTKPKRKQLKKTIKRIIT